MKKRRLILMLMAILAINVQTALAQKNVPQSQAEDIYRIKSFDKYRQIKYWGLLSVSCNDYSYGSGNSNYLGLTYKDNEGILPREKTNKELIDHFKKEFERLIKNGLPFHDTNEGFDDRFMELYKKFGEQDNFSEIFDAHEESRRNSLYGPNPGGVFCLISIERREFPILYEMKTSIVANNELQNLAGLDMKKLGFSTPELILGELKQSITQQLEELRSIMERINKFKK